MRDRGGAAQGCASSRPVAAPVLFVILPQFHRLALWYQTGYTSAGEGSACISRAERVEMRGEAERQSPEAGWKGLGAVAAHLSAG